MYNLLLWALLLGTETAYSAHENSATKLGCYNSKNEFYPYMGTRTAYDLIHGKIKRPSPSCEPMQIWGLIRHGTRFFKSHEIGQVYVLTELRNQIIKNHKRGLGELCRHELEIIGNWTFDDKITRENAEHLTEQGHLELYNLAQRLQKAFPELLNINPELVNDRDFVFAATNTTRAKTSLESFMHGISGNVSLLNPDVPSTNDTLLFKYKYCKAWVTDYFENDYEMHKRRFTQGLEFEQLIENIQKRLGFGKELTESLVISMYQMCRFELAWDPHKKSVWCSVFSKKELKVFEYREDLMEYYCCGPGRPISSKVGCEMMSDMFRNFMDLEESNFENKRKATFYFSHTIGLGALMSALKMHREPTPMTWKTYGSSENRIFRSSTLGAFASNIIGVFYRCSESKKPNKVMFYASENIVEMPGCNEEGIKGFCDWERLKRIFRPEVQKCNFAFCENGSRSISSNYFAGRILIFFVLLLLLKSL